MSRSQLSENYLRGLEGLVEKALSGQYLRGFGRCDVRLRPATQQGASGSSAYEANAKLRFFVKYDVDPATRPREVYGYNLLKAQSTHSFRERLIPMLTEDSALPILLFPLLDEYKTLHDWLSHTDDSSTDAARRRTLYQSILRTFHKGLWTPSKVDKPAQVHQLYETRARERVASIARSFGTADYQRLLIKINGETLGKFGEFITNVSDAVKKMNVPYSCTLHGDEHPKNLLVGPNDEWFLVDFASARDRGDWVYSIAKLLHWWRVSYALHSVADGKDLNYVRRLSPGPSGSTLDISYDADKLRSYSRPFCGSMERMVLRFGGSVAKSFSDSTWMDRLPVAYFCVVLGNVPGFLRVKKRQFFAGPMIHDAVSALMNPNQFQPRPR